MLVQGRPVSVKGRQKNVSADLSAIVSSEWARLILNKSTVGDMHVGQTKVPPGGAYLIRAGVPLNAETCRLNLFVILLRPL